MDLKTYSIYISIYSKLNLNNEKIQANEHVLKNEQMILTLRFYYITNMKNEEINEQALNEINKKRNLNLKKTKKINCFISFSQSVFSSTPKLSTFKLEVHRYFIFEKKKVK